MSGWTDLPLPLNSFISGYVMNPIAIPVDMLDVSGIVKMIANAGNASSNVFQLTFAKPSIMKQPTIIKTGAVIAATDDMADINGEKKIDAANKIATTVAVKPVRPPAATPVLDST